MTAKKDEAVARLAQALNEVVGDPVAELRADLKGMEERLAERIDKRFNYLNKRIETTNKRLDSTNKALVATNKRIDGLEQIVGKDVEHMGKIIEMIGNLLEFSRNTQERLTKLEAHLRK